MSAHRLFVTVSTAIFLSVPASAWAHDPGDGPHRVELHVGNEQEECYFDLHPELTEAEFQEFAAEGGQIVRNRQLSGAHTLGKGRFDVSVAYAYFWLDDTKGAWNNTMSHPDEHHYLGQQLGFPQLHLRMGVTARVDAEVYGGLNPLSNYGFVGVGSKIAILEQGRRRPVSVTVRPSVSALLGPEEVQAWNVATDVAVGRSFGGLAPFAGLTLSSTLAIDASPDTDVGNQVALRPVGFVGVEYTWKLLTAAAQAELSELPGVALRVGGRF
jgi:hypothetical protein